MTEIRTDTDRQITLTPEALVMMRRALRAEASRCRIAAGEAADAGDLHRAADLQSDARMADMIVWLAL